MKQNTMNDKKQEEKGRKSKEGISLRKIHLAWLLLTVLISASLLSTTILLIVGFRNMTRATDAYIEMQQAAYDLMDASDLMTESARRYVLTREQTYMRDYFEEALETRRREKAVELLSGHAEAKSAFERLNLALEKSIRLMDREYYAMRLAALAEGYTTYPDALNDVVISEEDLSAGKEEKLAKAQMMLFDEEYCTQKQQIETEMNASLHELDSSLRESQKGSTRSLRIYFAIAIADIVLLLLGIFFLTWLVSYLGIGPILKAVDEIKSEKEISIKGAKEFRYLAKTYNKLFNVYRNSITRLNYAASHDELTRVYNRAGYDEMIATIDFDSTYLIVIDADEFKSVNDRYGHEIGDKVLQSISDSIRKVFRQEDFVFRVGGDEFVVLMTHVNREFEELIGRKIEQINALLQAEQERGLPPISVSAGAAFSEGIQSAQELFNRADEALYEVKRHGRKGIAFYDRKSD